MSQPPQYNRLYNLTEYATANPSAPYDAAKLDAELDAVEASFYQTLINLALLQRDDGALKNNIVTLDSLDSSVASLLTANESTIRGAWLTATAYALKDVVTQSGTTYICAVAHTSGTFSTDLAAVKWVALNAGSSVAATAVSFTPAGSVAAVTVQAAIEEVDLEKLAKASNLSDVASRATAFTNLVAPGGTMTGALTFSGARLNEAKGADIASAGTIDLDAATGNLVDVTGTTTITAITLSEGRETVVRFAGVLTLTHGASLVLPGSASIVTAAGDFAVFRGYPAGVVRCVIYSRSDGSAISGSSTNATITTPTITTPTLNGAVSGTSVATQAEMETGTATNKLMTPGRAQYHPGVAKAWAGNNNSTLQDTYNVSSLTNNGTGDYTYNFSNALSTATYSVVISGSGDRATPSTYTRAVGSFRISWLRTNDSSAQASGASGMAVFGDFA